MTFVGYDVVGRYCRLTIGQGHMRMEWPDQWQEVHCELTEAEEEAIAQAIYFARMKYPRLEMKKQTAIRGYEEVPWRPGDVFNLAWYIHQCHLRARLGVVTRS